MSANGMSDTDVIERECILHLDDTTFEYRIEDGGVEILRCTTTRDAIDVPSTIAGYPVTAIASLAFSGCRTIGFLNIPESVRTIGRRAFEGCSGLKNVRLPQGLRRFDAGIFDGCGRLEYINIPDAIEKIDRDVLNKLDVRKLHIGRGVRSIVAPTVLSYNYEQVDIDENNPCFSTDGSAVFTKDGTKMIVLLTGDEEYTVPDGCRTIGRMACVSRTGLRRVNLPDSLENIEEFAFSKSGIENITIPSSVRTIQSKAFYYCTSLVQVDLPSGLESIGDEAFELCSISSISIPATVTHLGRKIFSQTSVSFLGSHPTFDLEPGNPVYLRDGKGGLYEQTPDGLVLKELSSDVIQYDVLPGTVGIAAEAAKYHQNLTSITFPEGLAWIGASAFKSCEKLAVAAFPDSLEEIGDECFFRTALKSVFLPRGLRHLGRLALFVYGGTPARDHAADCTVSVHLENPWYYVQNGTLCERGEEGDTLLLYVGPDQVVEVPDTVTALGECAFCGVRGLRELHLPSSIRQLGFFALNVSEAIRTIRVDFARPVEGCDHYIAHFSDSYTSCNVIARFVYIDDAGIAMRFGMYDRYLLYGTLADFQYRQMLDRLENPVKLSDCARHLYQGFMERHIREVCIQFAERNDTRSLSSLVELGLIDRTNIGDLIDQMNDCDETAVTGYLLNLKRERFGLSKTDFSL